MEKYKCFYKPLFKAKCHSPLKSAESDLTWTTRMKDLGGSVREDKAQSNGEPTLPPIVGENEKHAQTECEFFHEDRNL